MVLPKSRPNTSRDFLQPPRSSEPKAGASSEVDARSGISAPLTWGRHTGARSLSKGRAGGQRPLLSPPGVGMGAVGTVWGESDTG